MIPERSLGRLLRPTTTRTPPSKSHRPRRILGKLAIRKVLIHSTDKLEVRMRLATRSDVFFRRHERARFAVLEIFMSALAAFAVWRLVAVTTDNPSRVGWSLVSFAAGLLLCSVAWIAFLGVPFGDPSMRPARGLSRRTTLWLSVIAGVGAVVAVEPEKTNPAQFWQPGWLQLIGAGFWLGLALFITVRRARQRAWRGFKTPER
jgi:hypothetical protein